ncbi:hypothetical protein Y88_1705 [Novosphingobium nitrogenifigens DSM 19370]|uniref:Uncharacterized protein n=1 Tax=Novosphingobium nitrogenifigens DSM 19370 TaxID=983920 RepID=F1Z3K4_9SPHN|nr:hypothetical protein Y88_1705 [Novosphingobium nitrogenifigens DSM 19370]
MYALQLSVLGLSCRRERGVAGEPYLVGRRREIWLRPHRGKEDVA